MHHSAAAVSVLGLATALTTSCARQGTSSPPAPKPAATASGTEPCARLQNTESAYWLTWGGQRIGDARETVQSTEAQGYTFRREERIAITRGTEVVHMRTVITIELDRGLRARQVHVARDSAFGQVSGQAVRDSNGSWVVTFGTEPSRTVDAAAVPVELVPMVLQRTTEHRYEGVVLRAGYGFATAAIYAHPAPTSAHKVLVTYVGDNGVATNELEFDSQGALDRVTAPGGVEATRVSPAALADPFTPPELVDSTTIPVAGAAGRDPEPHAARRLVLHGVQSPAPPPLPGQRVDTQPDHWTVALDERFTTGANQLQPDDTAPAIDQQLAAMAEAIVREGHARTPTDELRLLVRYTDHLLRNDLAVPTPDARAALALGRGDCTAHATLFAGLAAARAFPVRLVTGYRLDGQRLVRHRWAIVWLTDRWIAVDPTYGEMPAAALNFGLAVHGTAAREIAAVDEYVFSGFRDVTAALSR